MHNKQKDIVTAKNTIKTDCFYFSGGLPCRYHKVYQRRCSSCGYYKPIREKILIIKLGSAGDVLRTTPLSYALKKKYKNSYITWLVEQESRQLLENNTYIDRILNYTPDTILQLQIEEFTILINLDLCLKSAALASIIEAKEKNGFGLDKNGKIIPLNKEALYCYKMSIFDDAKKKNRKTYQEIIFEIVKLDPKEKDLIFSLTKGELEFGEKFRKRHKISTGESVIGINTGAGKRWPLKKWTTGGFRGLIDKIGKTMQVRILLFGGTLERNENEELLVSGSRKLINAGFTNNLRQFASLLNLCDLVITGDTLCLHLSLALKKKIVVLFGPTSASEVSLYYGGKKIRPKMDCICCYKQICDKHPNCMESIRVETVYKAVREIIEEGR